MGIDLFQTLDVIEVMENYIERNRPPEHLRALVDLCYKIDNQSIIVFQLRPKWQTPGETMESYIAKATFIKAKDHWKIFWYRADLKWHGYAPVPEVKDLRDFVKLIEEDRHGCFSG